MGDIMVVLIVILYSTADGSTRVDISPPMSMDKCIERRAAVDIPRNYTLMAVDCTAVRPEVTQ